MMHRRGALLLRPPLTLQSVSGSHKRRQEVVISARVAERSLAWKGRPPPKRVAITEWDSLEKAEAFFKSKAWTDLGPERDKGLKTIRRYAVEVVQ
jgi:hypothetical protein